MEAVMHAQGAAGNVGFGMGQGVEGRVVECAPGIAKWFLHAALINPRLSG